jgi:hypothetical protein
MARPKSNTVDYFTHDSNASIRKTLTVIEKRFGTAGYAFWYKLLEWLGGSSEGHYYDAREPSDLELLSRKCGSDVTRRWLLRDELNRAPLSHEKWKY